MVATPSEAAINAPQLFQGIKADVIVPESSKALEMSLLGI